MAKTIDSAELEKTWAIITTNADYSSEEEYKNYSDAVKHGGELVDGADLSGLSADLQKIAQTIKDLSAELA